MNIKIPVSLGEVYDKISILEIKKDRIEDEKKLKYIQKELTMLEKQVEKKGVYIPKTLYEELKKINEELWDIEDILRKKYDNSELDEEYMKKMVFDIILNDKRFLVKKKINEYTNSDVQEQKSYKGM